MSKIHSFDRGGWNYTVVNVADDTTTVWDGPCYVQAICVNTVLSAQALPITDGATTVFSLAASTAVGANFNCYGTKFNTSLIVNPNDAATGSIAVIWKPA